MLDDRELDVRPIPRPQRHQLIFAAYEKLEVGQAILLSNDHEPRHLREDFERELPGSFAWESLGESPAGTWRVRIVRITRTPLPRIMANSRLLLAELEPSSSGSVWQLNPAARDLDANVIALPPGGVIGTHDGPDLDVLLHVIDGSGTLETESGELVLMPGAIAWLPRRSQRRIEAGSDGLRYLSVHHRKPALSISATPPAPHQPTRQGG